MESGEDIKGINCQSRKKPGDVLEWNQHVSFFSFACQDKDESIVALLIDEVIEKAYDFAVVFPGLQRKCFPREMGVQEEVGDGCKTNCFRGWNKWWLKKVILMESDDSMCPSKSRALCGGPPRTPLSPPLFTLSEQASMSCSKSQSRSKSHSRSRSQQTQQKIRTKMVAPGGEALGGVIGAFRHMIETKGFFSLYKGLPSIISMAPSGVIGAFNKSAYLHSPNGRKRLQHMKEAGHGLNALEQMELGTLRTLMYWEIAGCCAEAATYPFEVVRRQLQMQVRATKMSAAATFIKIVDQVAYLPCMQV